jgi:hypothetical protein
LPDTMCQRQNSAINHAATGQKDSLQPPPPTTQ